MPLATQVVPHMKALFTHMLAPMGVIARWTSMWCSPCLVAVSGNLRRSWTFQHPPGVRLPACREMAAGTGSASGGAWKRVRARFLAAAPLPRKPARPHPLSPEKNRQQNTALRPLTD